jgi:microsomal dipeptidase-like Zn-dependent dipeptidase
VSNLRQFRLTCVIAWVAGCEAEPTPTHDVYEFANGCYAVESSAGWLSRTADDAGYRFSSDEGDAARFFMKAADLGTYLFYDRDRGYLVADEQQLTRQTSLVSDVTLVDDAYVSGALWQLEPRGGGGGLVARSLRSGRLLAADGTTDEASTSVALTLRPVEGCTAHPELSVDAQGHPEKTLFDDGDLFGIVDTHSHILSNWAFGGGNIFHGAPFHPLGVEHALPDCAPFHGEMGRKDFFGYAFDAAGPDDADLGAILPQIVGGELDEDNHQTAGYPQFTEWPSAPNRSTHQTQYYRWLERAHRAGLRLVIQHATTNAVICHLMAGGDVQKVRYSCEDMVAVDRIIEETYAMERYIDAQFGGPGRGWFRIVFSPQEAREEIAAGNLAVVLGIETSDLFDCRIVPRASSPVCDESYVVQQLDRYWDLGVRVLFPVHKYDNAFSAGDGHKAFIELGNFANSGHWSNFVEEGCPDVNTVFDDGTVEFGGLNMPREVYMSAPPNDFSGFPDAPLGAIFPFISHIGEPPLEGDYCQNHGLTPLGELLIREMMARGMIIEIDHLPRRSYVRAFELLEANDYPAAGTHGTNNAGRLYALGGISKMNLGRCRDPQRKGAMLDGLLDRVALIEANGGYPAEGFGFDLNGFAGAPGPRFGPDGCATPQEDPITYPFTSYAGDVTFTAPSVGERLIDFNTEGMVHIGLLPELLEDARADAVSDADLEPLFRSAEGYLRMWEKAEARGAALGGG